MMINNIFRKCDSFLTVLLLGTMSLTSCYDSPDDVQPYGADELTVEQTISERENLTAFNAILKKCGYDKKLSTYLEYTCFAPVNEGVSIYLDSLYYDDNRRFPHNGIQETSDFKSLTVDEKVALMSDSLCEDICKYHISGELFNTIEITGQKTCSTLLTGRTIAASIFSEGEYAGMTSLNKKSAILEADIEALNGRLNICSHIIPRNDRTIDDQFAVEKDLSIFRDALILTGLDKTILQEKKDTVYRYAETSPDDGKRNGKNKLYCPTECLVKWTVFAETDDVFRSAGIKDVYALIDKCKEWYSNPTWYTYLSERGVQISKGTDYTNEFNVLHMFVAYHILRAGMDINKIVYEYGSTNCWNICFGYEPQEYFETLLPNTLMKIWETKPTMAKPSDRPLFINRYRLNNTLTDELGTMGSEITHPILFEGVQIDRTNGKSVETLNGYIHRLNGILLYDENAVNAQNERIRLDSSTFLYELINNGLRFTDPGVISKTYNSGGNGARVAFDNAFFDNIVCYNPNTLLRFCVQGDWRANNGDQFQGWDAYDFAIKLPHVPTGTYELRIVYPPMKYGGLMQFYLGNSPRQSDMVAKGIPFDACADPTLEGNVMGCVPIYTETDMPDTDYGVESDGVMHVRGYMRAPASFSRGNGDGKHTPTSTNKLKYDPLDIYSAAKYVVGATTCRSEWGYGTSMLRRIICTEHFEQGKDYWLRIKNLVNNEDLVWSFDFIELCPASVYGSQTMSEDWY